MCLLLSIYMKCIRHAVSFWAGGIHSAKKLDVLCGSCQCAYLLVGHSCFGRILKDLTVLLRGMGGELEMIISGNLGDTSLLYQAELP